jgi:hypothetical protein
MSQCGCVSLSKQQFLLAWLCLWFCWCLSLQHLLWWFCWIDGGRLHSLSLFTFLFIIHLFHVYSSFFFWCLVQSGLFLFLKLAFLCYSSTALAGGYSCVTLTLTLTALIYWDFLRFLSYNSRLGRPILFSQGPWVLASAFVVHSVREPGCKCRSLPHMLNQCGLLASIFSALLLQLPASFVVTAEALLACQAYQ